MNKSGSRRPRLMFILRATAGVLGTIPVHLQAQGVLDEITVTAQKREQSIQDVGIAITAYSGDQLRQLGVEDSSDIAAMTPGVNLSGNNGGQKTLFTIRGVTQNDFNDHTEAPVAVYVDDGYVAFGQGQVFGVFDLERVEALKGPQGTLFGRNATGGLVHYVSKAPTKEPEAYAETTFGSYDQIRIESALSGPLSETVSGRLAVGYNRFDPVIDNDYPNRAVTLDGNPITSDRVGTLDDDTLAVRGQLQFEPGNDVTFRLIGNYARSRQNTSPFLEFPTVPVFDAAGNHVGTVAAGPNETREAMAPNGMAIDHPLSFDADLLRPPGGNLYGPSCTAQDREDLACSMDFTFEDLNTTDTWGVGGKLAWSLGNSTLTSVTDYKDFRKFQAIPADGGPATTVNAMFDAQAQTFSQELRLDGVTDRFRWVTGAYYLNIDLDSNFSLPAEPGSLFVPLAGVPWEDVAMALLETRSTSLFGQVEFDVADTVTLIAGLRGIREEKDFTGEETFFLNTDSFNIDTDTVLFNVQPRRQHEQSDNLWSGKLQVEWRPVDDLLLYTGVNRGVKAGGFNSPATFGGGFPVEDIPYGEEVLTAYEAGFKLSGLFGGTTRLNGAAYYYDYQDYQGFFFTQITGFVTNVDAKYKGMELELISSPLDGLDLMLNFALLDATVYDIQIGPGIFKDSRPSFAPETTAAALTRYEFPQEVLGGNVSLQASVNYVSNFYDNIRNFAASKLPGYTLGNIRAGWQSVDDRWEASVFVNNVADKRYYIIGYDLSNATGSNSLTPGKPRWVGASLRFNFK